MVERDKFRYEKDMVNYDFFVGGVIGKRKKRVKDLNVFKRVL